MMTQAIFTVYKHMIADFSQLRKLPPHDDQRGCFGKKETSPINKQLGLFTDGKSLFTQFQPLDNHIGWGTIIHGGVIATILDEILGWEAVLSERSICVTKSINVNFHKSASYDDTYTIVAKFDSKQGNDLFIQGEVYNSGNILCVSAIGIYNALHESKAKKLKIMPPEQLSRVLEYIKNMD
jgi:acyl-coenzyme A thioesterase PaaI-like protein